jgi:hypothetical protein
LGSLAPPPDENTNRNLDDLFNLPGSKVPMNLEKNLAEMAQGVLVAQRNARRYQLQRWEEAHKIYCCMERRPYRHQAWFRGPHREGGVLLAECPDDKDYPTEAFVAQVALGIQALSNFDGVREPEQREKSEVAKHVIDWKKWAPA